MRAAPIKRPKQDNVCGMWWCDSCRTKGEMYCTADAQHADNLEDRVHFMFLHMEAVTVVWDKQTYMKKITLKEEALDLWRT